MTAFIYNRHILKGTPEAIEALDVAIGRLEAFEHMTKDLAGYPSILEMQHYLYAHRSADMRDVAKRLGRRTNSRGPM